MGNPAGAQSQVRYDVTLLTSDDLFLFNQGSHFRLYEKLGAHPLATRERKAPISPFGRRMRRGCR